MNRKRILCFGDSYTWGYIPWSNHERFSENIRFPKKLQELLGEKFEIIEEWLNSRTLNSEDERPWKQGKNGSSYLIPCLDSHDPLNLVILLLGTNELKHIYRNSPEQIWNLFESLFVKVILNRKSQFQDTYAQVLIISLPIINEETKYASERYIGATEKAKKLTELYSEISSRDNCHFLNASNLEVGADGVHLTEESHIRLAKMLDEKIKSLKI